MFSTRKLKKGRPSDRAKNIFSQKIVLFKIKGSRYEKAVLARSESGKRQTRERAYRVFRRKSENK